MSNTTGQIVAASAVPLRDQITQALHTHLCGCPDLPDCERYTDAADVVLAVLAGEPGRWAGALAAGLSDARRGSL